MPQHRSLTAHFCSHLTGETSQLASPPCKAVGKCEQRVEKILEKKQLKPKRNKKIARKDLAPRNVYLLEMLTEI